MTDAVAVKPKRAVLPKRKPKFPTGRIEMQGEVKMSDLGRYAIDWMQKVIKTDDNGTPFKIARYQEHVLRDVYATYGDGSRITNRYVLSIGRKNGKSTFSAAINLLEMSSKIAPYGGWWFAAAAGSKDQASLVYNAMCSMVERQPMLKRRYTISRSARKITNMRRLNTLEALSTSARSAQGREAHGFTFDEYAQARDNQLLDALDKSGRSISNGLGLVISTNSTLPGNPMLELIDLIRLAHSRGQLAQWNYRVYAPDLSKVDWMSNEAIFAANPGLYEDPSMIEWQILVNDRIKAKNSPSERKLYITYRLNASSGTESALVDPMTWKELGVQPAHLQEKRKEHEGKPCVLGIDLSKTTDMSAVVAYFPDTGYVRSCAWLPEDRVDELEVLDKAPYTMWVDDGWLRLCKGNTVDYDDLAVYVKEMLDTYDVRAVRYDPYMWTIFKHSMEKQGFDTEHETFKSLFIPFAQGYKGMTPAIASLEKLIEDKSIVHENDPLLASAMVGMKIKDSGNTATEARMPSKSSAVHRIDAAVALIMACHPLEVEEKPVDAVPSSDFLQKMRERYGG